MQKNMDNKALANVLRSQLHNGAVAFTFTKVNGEIRHAVGTLALNLVGDMDETKLPKSVRNPSADTQPFFDLEKKEWRSFKVANLVSVEGELDTIKTKYVGSLRLEGVFISEQIGFEYSVYDEDGEYQGKFFGNPETATEEEVWAGL